MAARQNAVRPVAAPSGPTTLAADTFNRVAAALTTASDGGTWATVGAWNTDGTQATCAVAAATATRDVGQSNYTLSVKIVSKQAMQAGVHWRKADASNLFSLQVSDANTWYIRSTVAGVDTNYFADTIGLVDGDTIAVTVNGTSHIFKKNGATVLTKTYTELPTGTKFALATNSGLAGTAIYDDVLVTTP